MPQINPIPYLENPEVSDKINNRAVCDEKVTFTDKTGYDFI